jgi:hypothetical protein
MKQGTLLKRKAGPSRKGEILKVTHVDADSNIWYTVEDHGELGEALPTFGGFLTPSALDHFEEWFPK